MTPIFVKNICALLRRVLRSREGTAAIEMAFAVPIFALIILGVMEVGRLMWAQSALNYSVEKGARCMLVSACDTSSAPTAASTASGYGFAASVFTATTAACGNQVTATYTYNFMTYVINYPITLTATSCM